MSLSKMAEQKHEVNPIPEIPFLIYSLLPGRNNTLEWLEAVLNYCLRVYGEVALVIETGEFHIIAKPSRPTEEALQKDDLGLVLLEYKEQLKQWVIRCADMDKKKIQIYAVLIGQLSKESKARLKQVATWEQIEKGKCPKDLIKAIRETHLTTETGFALKDKFTARTEYYARTQETTENTVRFKQRFDHKLKQFKAVADPNEVPKDADQAIDFINRLDKTRYGQLQADLGKNAALNIGAYPADLQKAYTIVSQYKMVDMVGGASSTTEPQRTTVFVAASDIEGKPDQDKKNESKERRRSGRGKQGASTQEEGDADSSTRVDRRPKKPCVVCGSTRHWTDSCPELKEVVAARKAEKAAEEAEEQGTTVGLHMGIRATDFVVL